MTALVLDASAAVELISRTAAGASVSRHITNDKVLWVPDGIFDVEANAALRRLELRQKMSTAQCATARLRLRHLRLRRRRVSGLADQAWSLRANITFPDACYVALAQTLDCPLLTTDMKLVNAPTLPVPTLHA